jgi:uncharacterized protein (TIGR03083 family)
MWVALASVAGMARLDFPTYLEHIRAESARFHEVLVGCDPAAPVPSCPEWTAADLLWHLVGVQDWWAWCIENRPQSPQTDGYVEPERPASYDEMLAQYAQTMGRMISALEAADPKEEAYTWKADEQTVGFTYRRQAHEALIHRVDAELAAGVEIAPLDARLAADGVDEVLDVMYGGCPPWGEFNGLDHFLRVDMDDVDQQVWVQLGVFSGTDPKGEHHEEQDIHVVSDPGREPDAVISGTAQALDLRLWRRGDGAETHLAGDLLIVDRFRQIVHQPIN